MKQLEEHPEFSYEIKLASDEQISQTKVKQPIKRDVSTECKDQDNYDNDDDDQLGINILEQAAAVQEPHKPTMKGNDKY